jgi:hypothetical protein
VGGVSTRGMWKFGKESSRYDEEEFDMDYDKLYITMITVKESAGGLFESTNETNPFFCGAITGDVFVFAEMEAADGSRRYVDITQVFGKKSKFVEFVNKYVMKMAYEQMSFNQFVKDRNFENVPRSQIIDMYLDKLEKYERDVNEFAINVAV